METLAHLLLRPSLTLVVFLPAILALPLLLFRPQAERAIKRYALAASLVELAVGAWVVFRPWRPGAGYPMLRDRGPDGGPIGWIESFGIRYDLALDGISMPLVALTLLLLPLILLGSWRGITRHWREYAIAMLVLTTGMLGALTALDLFLFYVFWEILLIPMYLIIGIWGGERRIYAALKFFLFTMAGSLPMLVGIVWLGWTYQRTTGTWSFAYEDLLRLDLPLDQQLWLFAAFALAFAIKVPLFPLHTWLPDAHVEAPTGGSVVLAGVLLKLGTYGFLRFALPLFPQAALEAAPLLVALALVGILYGALVAWAQSDMKKLVAYSSVAHLGFVMLGLMAFERLAWEGALLQMVNHGLSTGALFLLVGMLYDRLHTKRFEDLGGLAKVMPWYAFFLVFSALASVGLPMLNGFVGEFLILLGSYRATWIDLRGAVVLATLGVVLAAVYLLKMLYRTLWGPLTREENRTVADLDLREKLVLAPLCVLMLWIGVAPAGFLAPMGPALADSLAVVEQRLAEGPPAEPRLRPEQGSPRVAASSPEAVPDPEEEAIR